VNEAPQSPLPTAALPLEAPFITRTVIISLESGITGTVVVTETAFVTGTIIVTSPLILPTAIP
jgi:hypothetical protein